MDVQAVILDVAAMTVVVKGERVHLTHMEWRILRCLAQTPGKPVPRAALWRAMGFTEPFNSKLDHGVINVHVCRLRKKLGSDAIETYYKDSYALFDEWVERCPTCGRVT